MREVLRRGAIPEPSLYDMTTAPSVGLCSDRLRQCRGSYCVAEGSVIKCVSMVPTGAVQEVLY